MKFYRYKQVQRLTFFGFDDVYFNNNDSLSKRSPQSVAAINNDTKLLRFDIPQLYNVQLSKNARIVIESIYLQNLGAANRAGPVTVRMNNLNTHSYDSQNRGLNSTLLYSTEQPLEPFHNNFPEILYNFSIPENFFQNGYIELSITYPNAEITAADLARFNVKFIVYDIDEEELLSKDTPEVNYKDFRPHFNINNGRIPK
jgi:hypothetical protein